MSKNSLRSFFIMWQGQLISIIGSGLSGFALGVWVYQKTGSATIYGIVILMANLPGILIKPLAGFWADRFNRRMIIILSDLGSGLAIFFIALMLLTNHFELWQIYLGLGLSSLCNGIKMPAYEASITQLIPKNFYGQASGMVQASSSSQYLISPILAGILVGSMGIKGVIIIDVLTFFYAIISMLFIKIPLLERSKEGNLAQGNFVSEITNGLKYMKNRAGLLFLLMVIFASNFLFGFFIVLIGPMILSFSTPQVLGTGQSISAIGMLISSVLMGIMGAPKKLVKGMFLFLLISGISYCAIGIKKDIPAIIISCFIFLAALPVINTCVNTILRKKVSQDMQGRVFSLGGMLTQIGVIISYVIAGPIVDKIFKPLFASGGPLVDSIGKIIGTGPGREIGLLFIITGVLTVMVSAIGYIFPRLRLLETELPDANNSIGNSL